MCLVFPSQNSSIFPFSCKPTLKLFHENFLLDLFSDILVILSGSLLTNYFIKRLATSKKYFLCFTQKIILGQVSNFSIVFSFVNHLALFLPKRHISFFCNAFQLDNFIIPQCIFRCFFRHERQRNESKEKKIKNKGINNYNYISFPSKFSSSPLLSFHFISERRKLFFYSISYKNCYVTVSIFFFPFRCIRNENFLFSGPGCTRQECRMLYRNLKCERRKKGITNCLEESFALGTFFFEGRRWWGFRKL